MSRSPHRRAALALASLLALGACQASGDLALTYVGTGGAAAAVRPVGSPIVTVGAVTDARTDGQAGTGQYGTLRGGYGNPLLRLSAPTPVSQEVAGVLRSALSARRLLATGAGTGHELRVRIVELGATKLVRMQATVRLEGSLVNTATGATAWTGEGAANLVEFRAIGGFDAQPLRDTVLRTLSQAVDAMLDRPDFVAALR